MVVYDDNDAVIKMCVRGRSPNMRHVARKHLIDLDFLFERFQKDDSISMCYIPTKEQIADIFTKASFTEVTWLYLLNLFQIGPRITGQNTCKPLDSQSGQPAGQTTPSAKKNPKNSVKSLLLKDEV